MLRKIFFLFCILSSTIATQAQRKVSFNDISQVSLRNNGEIMRNNEIKGYYLFAQTDQISKDSNAYALHVLDENLNKVKVIRFKAEAMLVIREAATTDSSMAFLFFHPDTKNFELRIYDFDGEVKQTYTRHFVKGMGTPSTFYFSNHKAGAENMSLHDAGPHGYIVVYTLHGKHGYAYEMHYYDADKNKTWKQSAGLQKWERQSAEIIAKTDSMIIVETARSRGPKMRGYTTKLTAYNLFNKKKLFDINENRDKFNIEPTSIVMMPGKDTMFIAGPYYPKNVPTKERSALGIAIYKMSKSGQVYSKTYNSWEVDIRRYVTMDVNGKAPGIGYLFPHQIVPGPDGKVFVVCEGYKKMFCPGGAVATTLLLPWFIWRPCYTKVVSTNMVVLEFNHQAKVTRSHVYEKAIRTLALGADYYNVHRLSHRSKWVRNFDYAFTNVSGTDDGHFSVCYNDIKRDSRREGGHFHVLRYNGTRFRDNDFLKTAKDKITSIYPAKPGFLMILEFNIKERKTEMRLEKIS